MPPAVTTGMRMKAASLGTGNWNSLIEPLLVMSPLLRQARKLRKQLTPIASLVENLAHLVASRAVAVELPMLQFDARYMLALGDEADFQFRLQRRIVLPLGIDIPRKQQAGWRLPGEHAAPVASAAIFAAFIPTSPDARFDNGVDGIHLADLVLSKRPPSAELFGEHSPGYVLRRVYADNLAHAVDIAAPVLLIHR